MRFVKVDPVSSLRFGSKQRKTLSYHPLIKRLFNRSVLDPAVFLRKGYPRQNLCILASIILSFHSRLGPRLSKRDMSEFEEKISLLNFSGLVKLERRGISIDDMTDIERRQCPISEDLKRLFPALNFFDGMSCNLFCVRKREDEFRLFPVSLSRNNRLSNYFQVDMIEVSRDLLEPNSQSPEFGHVLTIPNLPI